MELPMPGWRLFRCGGTGLLLLVFLSACASAPAPAAPTSTIPTEGVVLPTSASASVLPGAIQAPDATQVPTTQPTTIVAKPATRLALRQLSDAGKLFGLTELEIETDAVALNPFDPTQIDLSV